MRSLVLLTGLAAAAPASAATVVLVPLIPDGVDGKAVAGIHQLLSSELEFASGVDGVEDIAERPAELTLKCLVATTCLKTIARDGGGDWLIAGVLHNRGATYGLDLLLFDNTSSRIVRRKEWNVPTDATALANGMTAVVKELLTGEGSGESTEAAVASADFSTAESDDEVVLGAGPSAAELAAAEAARQAAAAEAARQAAAAESARQAAAAEAARKAAAADAARQAAASEAARQAAAAEASRLAAAEAARKAALAAATADALPADPVDEADIQFGASAADITAEDIDAIQFGAPPPIASSPSPAPTPVEDFDEPARPAPRPTPVRTAAPATASAPKRPSGAAEADTYGPDTLSVAVRGGYSNYYSFHFVTAGGEIAVPITSGLAAMAGLETYAVQRQLPPDLATSTGKISEWNTIFPLNIGLGYTVGTGRVQPRFGADIIAANYYRDEVGSDWAVGGRARADLDLYVTSNFGFQVHSAFGLWQGKNFPLIEQGVAASGFLPQVGAGTILAL